MSTSTKQRGGKNAVRKMYATEQFFSKPGIAEKLLRDSGLQYRFTVPVMVIRSDAESLDAMTERMARAIAKEGGFPGGKYGYAFKGEARAALRAIGLVAKKGKL